MPRQFFTPINLNGLELQGAAIGNLSTSSIDAITSGTGRIQYDSTLNVLKYRDNTGWKTISTGAGSFTLGSTSIALGSTTATIAGMTSVTSTTFVGALTGNASTATKWSSAVNLAGNSVDGSAAVAFANKFIVQGTVDAGLSGAQFLGALGTGILKNTTTTGVLSIAVAGDFPTLNQNTTGSAGSVANALTFSTGLTLDSGTTFTGAAARSVSLATVGTAGTYTKVTTDAYGRVSSGTTLSATDIPASLTSTTSVNGTTIPSSATLLTSTSTASALTSVGSLNGLTIAATQTVSMGGNKITNVGTPTADSDAATKLYVDSTAQGIDWKASVRAATTANGTLATAYANGSVIDGVTLATGNRILIKDQTTGSENGVYTVNASGAPTRAVDADTAAEIVASFAVFVEEGTANADSGFVLTNDGTITVGTTALVFTQFTGLGQVTAGTGLTKTGNTLNAVGTADRITANADSIDIASTYAGQSTITTVSSTTGITTGAWKATVIDPTYGGTGVANTGKTITLGGNLTTSGAFATTLTTTATTSVTLPTSGTLTSAAATLTAASILKGDGGSAVAVATGAEIATAIGASTVTNATNAGNSTTVTATESTSATTHYPVFATSGTGSKGLLLNAAGTNPLSYQPSTGTLTTTILTTPTVTSAVALTLSGAPIAGNGYAVTVNGGNTTTATTGTGGAATLRGGNATTAGSTATGGAVTISGGTGTLGTSATVGGAVTITGGDTNTTAGTGGAVTILGGNGFTKGALSLGTSNTASVAIGTSGITTTITGTTILTGDVLVLDTTVANFRSRAVSAGSGATTGNVTLASGAASGGSGTGTSGNVRLDVGYATGATSTAGTIQIGTQNAAGSSNVYAAPAAISIGQSGVTTTVTGGLSIPTIASATGLLKTTITTGVVGLAAAGTDYLAPPSGTALLKANSGGALANAVAGTDYIAPYSSQTANTFLAAPNGSTGTPTFRTVVYADLPTNVGVVARKVSLAGTGSGTSIALTHGLGTNLVTAQVYDTSTSTATLVEVDITVTSTVATATFASTTTLSNYTLVVVG